MECKKLLRTARGILLFSMTILGLVHCDTHQEYLDLLQKPAKDTSYYPYLARDQYEFLHRQNIIGIVPGSIIIPAYQTQSLEYPLNTESWLGSWPNDVLYVNYFIAEQAKRKIGCGPFKERQKFIIPKGIYNYKTQKVVVAEPLVWTLTTNLSTMCLTKSYLDNSYYNNDSIYWKIGYSKDRIAP